MNSQEELQAAHDAIWRQIYERQLGARDETDSSTQLPKKAEPKNQASVEADRLHCSKEQEIRK